MKFVPHDYQEYCIDQIIEKPRVALLLEMGLGKTMITLSAIQRMMGVDVAKVLVIAPLRVAQSGWKQEAEKWEMDLRVVRVLGNQKERIAALKSPADVYVINRENVAWLVAMNERNWPFDMIVIDELSSFKSPQAQRFKALKRVLGQVDRVVGLTGTPAPNSLLDLWSQIYLIDQGVRLGKFIGRYRDAYFASWSIQSAYGGQFTKYRLKPGAEQAIYKRIEDVCISMKAADYIKMPDRIDNVIDIEIPEDALQKYRAMEHDMVTELFEGEKVMAASAAAVAGKLLQMANGAVYKEDGGWIELHDRKLQALEDIVEAAQGKSVLVYYGYKFDKERIKDKFGDDCRVLESDQDVKDWNNGKIRLLLAHPDSAGHGLNLQAGGHLLVWYGLTWSLEKYQQACARLHRQGQTESVIIHHLVAKGTIDENVMSALKKKEAGQDALFNALKARL